MENAFYQGQVLWAQIDANQHMRHSAYADVCAQARLNMLQSIGMKATTLLEAKIGPVLFREELKYLREVSLGDTITVVCEVLSSRVDGSRWTIRHEIYRGDGVKAAVVIADGSWIDMEKRKLAILPTQISDMFAHAPRSADYAEEVPKAKE
ncbi:acyl-CoA thioesterase [Mucilaginibacter myungsuensis]|uniref:Thioesterase family protein n=1 Tax=Mucilaginibacter myungsuensis TaxID=649104 RepID=A0A929KT34_9SPHI|nr:acyl-CoA thioesterase [Mucilaginibacter myungsuensis]MBE9660672.1 thioesterase family protein [Mucilaginibacter myungsuensis]MDN3600717.1 acyl-CoA thioesterase [Mucilaginibacter myungsuensis]